MLTIAETTRQIVEYLRQKAIVEADVGIILGTGMGKKFLAKVKIHKTISYKDIAGFPTATVEFHSGRLHYGTWKKKKIIVMEGRFHYYEGHSMQQITLPVRVLHQLGIKFLLLSNAAGNLEKTWDKGDLMLVTDHINLQTDNPLRGRYEKELGPRFPDMSLPYAPLLNNLLLKIASVRNIRLRTGVYVAVTGPNLETRAEYKFLRLIGAHAVGMSTVPEVIVASQLSLPCCVVSILTDDCSDPEHLQKISIKDVVAVAAKGEEPLSQLFLELIARL